MTTLFSKPYKLKNLWEDIKKDATRARKGEKKPGGKQGFETLLSTLDKAVQSKDPDVTEIKKQTGSLVDKMKQYADKLPNDEKQFKDDIGDFIGTLEEIAKDCKENLENTKTDQKKLLVLLNQVSRIGVIGGALQRRHEKLKSQVKLLETKEEIMLIVKEIQGVVTALDKVQKETLKLANDLDKLMEKL